MSDGPQYLTRNREAIKNFLDTFDVSRHFIPYRRVEKPVVRVGGDRPADTIRYSSSIAMVRARGRSSGTARAEARGNLASVSVRAFKRI
jgi:hypothetical protein